MHHAYQNHKILKYTDSLMRSYLVNSINPNYLIKEKVESTIAQKK